MKVIPEESTFSAISDIMNLHMVASGTFTPTGDLGNSTGSFSEEWFSINTEDDNSKAPAIRSITGISNGTNTAATNTSSSTIIIPSNSSSFHSSSTRGYDTVNVVALSLSNQPKIKVVASFYPMYEFVKQVGGDRVDVSTLIPIGVEPHDYDPTIQQILNAQTADMLVYNSPGLETWVPKAHGYRDREIDGIFNTKRKGRRIL